MPDKAQARKFLDELFSGRPEESRILIWSLPSKSSRWFSSTEDAAGYGAGLEGAEVYVGCGLAGRDMGPNARCKAADIVGVPGVWIDIDVKGPTHKKPNLPPNRKEAMKLLDGAPLKPTIVVDSGGGYQAWWCFREFWTFDIDEERQNAERVTRGWNQAMKNLAAERGWDVDATWDLARIFRLPGTNNNKGKSPRPVRIVKLDDARYNLSDFELYLSETKTPSTARSSQEIASRIKLNLQAEPPVKFFALLENIPKAKATWDKKRKDLGDQSASSYDMSMTDYCVAALYEDQEIADTLIAMRRRHGSDLKPRDDYYGRTIARARADIKIEAEVKEAEETIDKLVDGEETEEKILDVINKRLKTRIVKLEKYLSDPPTYRVETEDGKSYHFSSKQILRQANFRDRYFELSNRQPLLVKPAQWGKITALVSRHIDENQVELGPEATDDGSVEGWIQQYLDYRKPGESLDKSVVERDLPWQDSDFIYLRNCDLRGYLIRYLGIQMGHKELPKRLRSIGIGHTTKNVPGKKTSRSYWKVRK